MKGEIAEFREYVTYRKGKNKKEELEIIRSAKEELQAAIEASGDIVPGTLVFKSMELEPKDKNGLYGEPRENVRKLQASCLLTNLKTGKWWRG